eukprot:jgi/Botrbrau1/13765/Bobra.0056s0021.1
MDDQETEDIIKSALEEQEYEKRARKQADPKKGKPVKLTDVEVEQNQGGTVRENMVALAQRERGKKRHGYGETDFVEDVRDVEEDFRDEEEDNEVPLEPFNLQRERQEGYFDEGGHYVENKKDNDEDQDPWLTSDEAKVVQEEVRRKVEEEDRKWRAAEDAPELTGREIAALKRKLANILQPGETVTRALKRLRPAADSGPKAKRGKKAEKAPETEEERQAHAQFEEATEAASMLMDAGELDVYTLHHSDFEAAASLYEPQAGLATTSAAALDDGDDMFEDDPSGEPGLLSAGPDPAGAAPSGTLAEPLIENGGPRVGGGAGARLLEGGEPDFGSWSIRELRQFLEERGIDTSTATEKEELISKAREATAAGAGPGVGAPLGYQYDASSGYYYSPESGLYWDASSGGFYSGENQKWYSFDQDSQQYVEWPSEGDVADAAEPAPGFEEADPILLAEGSVPASEASVPVGEGSVPAQDEDAAGEAIPVED